jgi:hypothetical protein
MKAPAGRNNPVLELELRRRTRGPAVATAVAVHLAVLGAVVLLVYRGRTAGAGLLTAPAASETASIGRSLFQWTAFALCLAVLAVVPGLTAGAIAGERERRTMTALQLTLLRPWEILAGKLGGAVAFLFVLVTVSLPLLAVGHVIGGVTIARVVATATGVLATGIALAGLTLACSALTARVQAATALAYGAVVLLVLGTFAMAGAASVLDGAVGDDPADPPGIVLAANPLVVVSDLAADRSGGPSVDTPLDGLVGLARRGDGAGDDRAIPLWLIGLGLQAAAASGALALAARRLRRR